MRPPAGEIADALFREDARFVTLFTIYLDASRDEGDSNTHVLAGFISDRERWEVFDAEWQLVLAKYGIPAFHMTDYESSYKAFKDWEPNDRRKIPFLKELLEVIARNTIASAGYGVSQSMYSAAVPPEVNKYIGGSPYFLLFLNLVLGVENMMDHAAKFSAGVPDDWQMNYVLARDDPGAGTAVNTWMSKEAGVIATRLESRVAGVSIAKENTKHLGLQAADLLAFEGRKQTGLQLGQHNRPTRRSFMALEEIPLPRAWHFVQHEHHLKGLVEPLVRAMRGEELPDLRDSSLRSE